MPTQEKKKASSEIRITDNYLGLVLYIYIMYRAPQTGAPSKRKHLRGYLPIKYKLYKPGPIV